MTAVLAYAHGPDLRLALYLAAVAVVVTRHPWFRPTPRPTAERKRADALAALGRTHERVRGEA